MAVKLTFGEPCVVAMGPTFAEAGWGTHQFPAIRRLPDGRIACSYHIVQDTCEDYGKENGWAISDDDGKTWRGVTPEELLQALDKLGFLRELSMDREAGVSFRFVDFFYFTAGFNVAEYQVLADGRNTVDPLIHGESLDDVTAKAWLMKPFISLSIDLDFLSYIKK